MDIEAFVAQFASLEMAEMMLMAPDHGHFSHSYLHEFFIPGILKFFVCTVC